MSNLPSKINFSNFYDCMNPVYWAMCEDRSKFQVIYGGAGSGKSYAIAQDELKKQIFEPGTNLLVLRQTGDTNRTSTFSLFKQLIAQFHLESVFAIRETDMTITCLLNNNEIRFKGLDNVEKVKSITFSSGPLTRVWIEEASEIRETDFNQVNLRLRGVAKVPFQIRLSFNPISSLHWLKGRFFDRLDERDRTFVLHSTYLDNLWLNDDYKQELLHLKDVDPVFYDIYCLGKWGTVGNLIFRNWVEEKTCPYRWEDFDELLCGMDFGYNHPTAIEVVGIKDEELWSVAETHVRYKTNADVIAMQDNGEGPLTRSMRCTADSAEPDRIKEWQNAGYNVHGAVKGKGSLLRGIDYIKSRKWHIVGSACPGLLAEVQSYKNKEDRQGNLLEEPVNFKDDGIAAVRYAVEQRSSLSERQFSITSF